MTNGLRRVVVSLGLAWFWAMPAARAAENWVEVRSPHFTVCTAASEKDARKIADQFEQFRELFHGAFPTMRVDTAQAVVILAAKGEKGMKDLLPEEWADKGHVHHAGMYQPGYQKHYVILRLDAQGENPYHVLYHEYTHSLMHLNFANLPLWLDEGLAEYLGNATIGDKESRIGVIDPSHLYILQSNRLLPIETLLGVDHRSPHYNESNRASVFYAESWALVHYLMVSPESRQKQLLGRFMEAWNKTGDQLEAARQAFGDLKKFGQVIEGYARQSAFYNGLIKNAQVAGDKNYPSRSLSAAEVLALRGDFFVHHNREQAGKPLLDEAAKQEPALAFAHEALAFYYFRMREMENTEKEIQAAIRLGAANFFDYYLHAVAEMQTQTLNEGRIKDITAALEKSAQLNPNFAPTFDGLANVYGMSPGKGGLAVNAAIKAVKLDATDIQYAVHLTYLLMNNDRDAEAKIMADRIVVAANTPAERERARSLVRQVEEHKQAVANGRANTALAAGGSGMFVIERKGEGPGGEDESKEGGTPATLSQRVLIGVEGSVTDVDCSKIPEIKLSVDGPGGNIEYHVADVRKITVTARGDGAAPGCAEWRGRKAKLWFRLAPGSKQPGEISKLNFQ